MPGFGSPPDSDPPPDLDYDMWLGPAPKRPYNPNRAIYHFRWFWDYSGGQMTNLGQHSLDVVHWFLDATAPTAVTSAGGRFALKDNGETPDTQDALFEYPGYTATWSHRECSRGADPTNGLEFCGTRGSLKFSRKGIVVTMDPKVAAGRAAFPGSAGPTRSAGQRRRASAPRPRARPRVSRTVPAMSTTSSSVTPETSSIAFGPAVTRFRTSRVGIVSPRRATWQTYRSGRPKAAVGRGPRNGVGRPRGRGVARAAVPAPWDAERNALLGRG